MKKLPLIFGFLVSIAFFLLPKVSLAADCTIPQQDLNDCNAFLQQCKESCPTDTTEAHDQCTSDCETQRSCAEPQRLLDECNASNQTDDTALTNPGNSSATTDQNTSATTPQSPESTRVPVPVITPLDPHINLTQQNSKEDVFTNPSTDPNGILKLRSLISQISNWLLSVLAGIAIIMLIFAGAMFLFAAGNDERLGKAKKIVQWVCIGMVIATLAWTLVDNFVRNWK